MPHTSIWMTASSGLQWVMAIFTLSVALSQFLVNHSNQGKVCVTQPDGVLAKESVALRIIVYLQVFKVFVFAVY